MSLHSLSISRAEKWNRIIWTILSISCDLVMALFCFACFIIACFQKNASLALWLAIITALYITPAWMIWHCTYKKHGTKLLIFLICIGPLLYILSAIANIINSAYRTSHWDLLILAPLLICWLLMGLQLVKTNKKLYMQKHCTDEYLAALGQMSASTSTDELTEHFNTLMLQWPQLKYHFTREYKAKKRKLQ